MKILISSRSFGTDNSAIEKLDKAGFDVILNPYRRKLSEDELIGLIGEEVVGLIAGTEQITGNVLNNAKSLKVISRYGVGMDNIDLKAAERNEILVKSTPLSPTQAVAELTLALILDLYRKISEVDRSLRSGKWDPLMGKMLYKKTIGIIGLGRIGKALVGLVQPFNMKIIAYEPYPDDQFVSSYGIEVVSLEKVMAESDVISIHAPLTEKTRNIISEKELSIMKEGAIIVNTARGELINEKDLINALKSNKIGGAALDVFKEEPYYGELKNFDNVILTPHIGTYTKETRILMEREAVENILNVLLEV